MSDFEVELLDLRELLRTPEPEWLIQDHIHQCEVGVIYGPANVGKSFVMIDWAMSVATGTPWLGRYPSKQAPVLYLAGEGAASLNKRVDTWMKFHKVYDAPILFQTRPLPLRESDIIADIQDALLTAYEDENGCISDVRPGLIIVDTLSQFMMGGDENGSDMALFVSNLRHLSQEQSAAIVVVHHTNKGGIAERGHTALRGNVDVMFTLKGIETNGQLDIIELINDKQRDSAKAKPVRISVTSFHKSLALSLAIPITHSGLSMEISQYYLRKLLINGGNIMSEKTGRFHYNEWILENGSPRSTFDRNVHKLLRMKLLQKHANRYFSLSSIGIETYNWYTERVGKYDKNESQLTTPLRSETEEGVGRDKNWE